MKRRKEGVSESEEGNRESVLSDDPPDSKWVFQDIPSNWWFLLPLKKGLPILQYEWISDIIIDYNCQVPDRSPRRSPPRAGQRLGPCRSPEIPLQSTCKGNNLLDDYIDVFATIDQQINLRKLHKLHLTSQVTVSNIIDQYVLHLESLDITPAKRSSATEVGPELLRAADSLWGIELQSPCCKNLSTGCERLGGIFQCFTWPSTALLCGKTAIQGKLCT